MGTAFAKIGPTYTSAGVEPQAVIINNLTLIVVFGQVAVV